MSDYANLPVIRLRPAPSDDDIEFDSDLKYLRLLLADIEMDWYARRLVPIDIAAWLEIGLDEISHHPDPAKALLDAWRQENKNPGLLEQAGATTPTTKE